MPPAKAVIVSYLAAWLCLPLVSINIPGLPNFDKYFATGVSIGPCLLLFAWNRFQRISFHVADIAVATWVLCPLASSLANGLGAYDGFAVVVQHMVLYGMPYLAGKVAIQNTSDWIIFARCITIAAILYIPFSVYEIRMSPVLHQIVYGVSGRSIWENNGAFGVFGWQPSVFMNSSFELSMMYVIVATFSMVPIRARRKHSHRRLPWLNTGLAVAMVVLCKKWSAIGLLGLATLSIQFRSRFVLYLLFLLPVIYMTMFASGAYRGEGLSSWVASLSERRSESLQFRIDNDRMLVDKAMERRWLGWGGWGRNRIYDENGKDISITDSAWMITFGMHGFLGLIAETLIFILPCIGLYGKGSEARRPAPCLAFDYRRCGVVVLSLHLIDNLFNGFPNPVFSILAGGLTCTARYWMDEPTAMKETTRLTA